MPAEVDYLIVGSGLTGATIARLLADAGREVVVLERRNHAGGNVFDRVHPSGIRIHTYGPHYFRTDSEEIWTFVNRFGSFERYEPCLKSLVDGQYENWPIAGSYIRKLLGGDWAPEFRGEPSNFEEASLAMMPRMIYEKFVRGYTRKQWGIEPRRLSASLARRFDVRQDDEPRLMRRKHQGIPLQGYARFMEKMLEGIPVLLGRDYLKEKEAFAARKQLVFTGPIDEFFGFTLGRLKYRGQSRTEEYFPGTDRMQPCGQVNIPDEHDGPEIRRLEWRQMMPDRSVREINGTVVTREVTFTPSDPDMYEYPFPDPASAALYGAYRALVKAERRLLICGRLGEYRYVDMDQAIARAFKLAGTLLMNDDAGNAYLTSPEAA